jgi:hypothetical protein
VDVHLQSTASNYRANANRLASYGYAVVQYDTASGSIIVDIVEVRQALHFDAVQQYLENLAAAAAALPGCKTLPLLYLDWLCILCCLLLPAAEVPAGCADEPGVTAGIQDQHWRPRSSRTQQVRPAL